MSEESDRDGVARAGDEDGAGPISARQLPVRLSPDQGREGLILTQLAECWADIRNYDSILWQIPAAIGAIAGLMLNALTAPIVKNGLWIRPLVAVGAAAITFPLIVALVKNRIFQIDRNNWRIALYDALSAGAGAAVAPRSVAPERAERPGLVLLSSPHVQARMDRGPWYWRWTANALMTVRAYNVLLLVSLLVFLTELFLAVALSLGALTLKWH